MIVIGSSAEYFNSKWLKNEWSRYLDFLKEDGVKRIVPCFTDSIDDIPIQLREYQCYNINTSSQRRRLVESINKELSPNRLPQFNINTQKIPHTTIINKTFSLNRNNHQSNHSNTNFGGGLMALSILSATIAYYLSNSVKWVIYLPFAMIIINIKYIMENEKSIILYYLNSICLFLFVTIYLLILSLDKNIMDLLFIQFSLFIAYFVLSAKLEADNENSASTMCLYFGVFHCIQWGLSCIIFVIELFSKLEFIE